MKFWTWHKAKFGSPPYGILAIIGYATGMLIGHIIF